MYVVSFKGHTYFCDAPQDGRTQRDAVCTQLILQEVRTAPRSAALLNIVGLLVQKNVTGAVRLWNKTFPDAPLIWKNIPVLRIHERRKWTVFD